jgi:hypothetical protein
MTQLNLGSLIEYNNKYVGRPVLQVWCGNGGNGGN